MVANQCPDNRRIAMHAMLATSLNSIYIVLVVLILAQGLLRSGHDSIFLNAGQLH
jgi:hypothetical protein